MGIYWKLFSLESCFLKNLFFFCFVRSFVDSIEFGVVFRCVMNSRDKMEVVFGLGRVFMNRR